MRGIGWTVASDDARVPDGAAMVRRAGISIRSFVRILPLFLVLLAAACAGASALPSQRGAGEGPRPNHLAAINFDREFGDFYGRGNDDELKRKRNDVQRELLAKSRRIHEQYSEKSRSPFEPFDFSRDKFTPTLDDAAEMIAAGEAVRQRSNISLPGIGSCPTARIHVENIRRLNWEHDVEAY